MINVLAFEPYPMGKIGGNLRTLLYITRRIDRHRFRLTILSPMETEFIERVSREGVECVVRQPPPSVNRYAQQALHAGLLNRIESALDLIRYNLGLVGLMRQLKTDVLYCNSIRAVLFAGLAARLAGVRVLWYVKGTLENPVLDRLGFLLSDRVLFFCESNRDDKYRGFVRLFRSKIGILKIGIDPETVHEAEREDPAGVTRDLRFDSRKVNIAVLGQVYRPKGVHFAIEALGQIVPDHPNVMLYVIGDHVLEEFRPYREELDAQVERLGLAKHVTFTGWRRDALAVLKLMDIVVHPSLAEGFGRAVLEAMALGRAVIASKVGGLREIIRDGENGFLVEPGDWSAIADRLGRLVRDGDLRDRFGREAKREVFAHYLLADKIHQLEDIWAEMANANRGRALQRRADV